MWDERIFKRTEGTFRLTREDRSWRRHGRSEKVDKCLHFWAKNRSCDAFLIPWSAMGNTAVVMLYEQNPPQLGWRILFLVKYVFFRVCDSIKTRWIVLEVVLTEACLRIGLILILQRRWIMQCLRRVSSTEWHEYFLIWICITEEKAGM